MQGGGRIWLKPAEVGRIPRARRNLRSSPGRSATRNECRSAATTRTISPPRARFLFRFPALRARRDRRHGYDVLQARPVSPIDGFPLLMSEGEQLRRIERGASGVNDAVVG